MAIRPYNSPLIAAPGTPPSAPFRPPADFFEHDPENRGLTNARFAVLCIWETNRIRIHPLPAADPHAPAAGEPITYQRRNQRLSMVTSTPSLRAKRSSLRGLRLVVAMAASAPSLRAKRSSLRGGVARDRRGSSVAARPRSLAMTADWSLVSRH